MSVTKIDTVQTYQTPEGVELSLSLAGPMVRGAAWSIDFGIRVVCYFILGIVTSFLGGVGAGFLFVCLFFIEWFYPVVFEVYNGMTPGKKAMGLQVVHEDGTAVSWSSSLLRNLIRSIDFMPLLNMVGLATMLLNVRFKRLGDYAAGTVVVYKKEKRREFDIPNCVSRPAPVPLTFEEQRLVLDFCERAGQLSMERRHELASHLDILADRNVPEDSLLAYGNWFLKGKVQHESKPV